jgi:hypothetical protein
MAKAKLTQILPSVRRSQRLRAPPGWADELTQIVNLANPPSSQSANPPEEDLPESFDVILVDVKAKLFAEHYVSEKENETPMKAFRRTVNRKAKGSIAAAVYQLLQHLADENQPPFAQMRSLFCTADATTDGFDKSSSEDNEVFDTETEDPFDAGKQLPEHQWSIKYSPLVVKEILARWLDLMDTIYIDTGTGRPPDTAENRFVFLLADYWKNNLRLPLVSGRGVQPGSDRHDQQGPFANFVRKAAEIIPPEYRPETWDYAIRKNVGKKP